MVEQWNVGKRKNMERQIYEVPGFMRLVLQLPHIPVFRLFFELTQYSKIPLFQHSG
jgi:hypothetical protein